MAMNAKSSSRPTRSSRLRPPPAERGRTTTASRQTQSNDRTTARGHLHGPTPEAKATTPTPSSRATTSVWDGERPKGRAGASCKQHHAPGPAFQRATDGPAPPPPPTTRVLVVMRVMYCCMMAFSSRSIAACSLTRPTRLCSSSRSVRKR